MAAGNIRGPADGPARGFLALACIGNPPGLPWKRRRLKTEKKEQEGGI